MKFQDSHHCKSGLHCTWCRQIERGRPWRVSLASLYVIPDGPDFACTYGREWGTESSEPIPDKGPGTELKKLFARIGIVDAPGCQCNSRAAQMDKMGPDWCENNLEEIVGWLREEAERQTVPFVGWVARKVVRMAIANARAADVSMTK